MAMSKAKADVDGKISSKIVFMFAKKTCPHCIRTKAVFQKLIASGELQETDYEAWDIDNESNKEAMLDYLKKLTGARTVPRVYIGGKCIGGADDVAKLVPGGKLKTLVADAVSDQQQSK